MEMKSLTALLTTMSLSLFLTACGSENGDTRVIVSTGDSIINFSDSQYSIPFAIQVASSNGTAQANTFVTLTVNLINFEKGAYSFIDTDTNSPPDGETDTWVKTSSLTCPIEVSGIDTNGNGLLDPITPSITSSATEPTLLDGTNTLITDNNGFGYFTLTYPKRFANWVTVQVIATAQDGLPENIGINEFSLFGALADVEDETNPPAFVVSPYGSSTAAGLADCSNTN